MNKYGFTLIELLAVIVILGVIMVIAIPFINGYIERSKKDAFDVSAGASEQTSVVGFKDSLSNSIYGNSTTVTPNNFSVVFYIKY